MNELQPIAHYVDRLDLMRQCLLAEPHSPGLAVCRFIKTIAPYMTETEVVQMSGCLIGSTAALIAQAQRDDPPDLQWLAATIVASILPAGAEL